jgi:hypothetical protein
MKILSVRRKIPLFAVLMGVQEIDGATQMFLIINFAAAATAEVRKPSGKIAI